MISHHLIVITAKERIEAKAFSALCDCEELGVASALLWFSKDA
jgi:hypothetical protein